ncbi:MAG: hypothetical protein CK425_05400 [Parachlamydia sp.]|nr:MAG: hypothetical protein CK425_05400 [Parachlamydia sp.]
MFFFEEKKQSTLKLALQVSNEFELLSFPLRLCALVVCPRAMKSQRLPNSTGAILFNCDGFG